MPNQRLTGHGEAEDAPGYHSTGRSAAFWEETYGGPGVVPLTLASGGYLDDHGFLTPRGALFIGRAGDRAAMDAHVATFAGTGVITHRLSPAEQAAKHGMKAVTDTGAIEAALDALIAANPDQVEKAKVNAKLAGWFTGQVLKATGGKANPAVVNAMVAQKLGL